MHDFLNEPNPVVAFLRLDEHYRLSGPTERSAIREGWDFGRRWHIPGLDYSNWERIVFAPLTGEDAYGLNAEARIEVRLTYHAIENARSDFRDNFLDLCLCYHCALRADLDVVQLFEEAAEVSDKKWLAICGGSWAETGRTKASGHSAFVKSSWTTILYLRVSPWQKIICSSNQATSTSGAEQRAAETSRIKIVRQDAKGDMFMGPR